MLTLQRKKKLVNEVNDLIYWSAVCGNVLPYDFSTKAAGLSDKEERLFKLWAYDNAYGASGGLPFEVSVEDLDKVLCQAA